MKWDPEQTAFGESANVGLEYVMTKETGDYRPGCFHVAENAKLAEGRLRARIRQAFSQQRGRVQMKTLEDEVLKLIEDYFAAPENQREEVYERGEKRLIRDVRTGMPHDASIIDDHL